MSDYENTKNELINAGLEAKLVDRTEETAAALLRLLDNIEMPADEHLKDVFAEKASR